MQQSHCSAADHQDIVTERRMCTADRIEHTCHRFGQGQFFKGNLVAADKEISCVRGNILSEAEKTGYSVRIAVGDGLFEIRTDILKPVMAEIAFLFYMPAQTFCALAEKE